ncbi:putative Pseudouridylate synthase 4 [Rhodotorula toruloides ATCC 204091]|uniref:tRNA pseudouridine(55) synthase n=1 Tax=Rhodotorula toruloides TaxID=5286 RepID=A0A0K3CJE2_RHOTO|nr:putative Pseudouridylate synthase 4 [Rhodotorula toruloides ATCC 204091]KAK4333216.1 tRNA pseudouridine synthase 4 [Rhodotorula toruloides]PRQ73335.1 putative pseudouridylate synthase 4 [Rhodotorula toruloides]
MPKAGNAPLSALFGLNKPTGVPSMTLLNRLQPLFSASELFKDPNSTDEQDQGGKGWKKGKQGRGRRANKVKMGQGGTLDPLADGVLVVGTNAATKSLSRFLDCTKEYRAIGLLGCSTDSYDSDGKRVKMASWQGITKEKVEEVLGRFRGEIEQTPPVYSALKMDGKPLYEYARSNTPLPRPIPPRKVTVHSLELLRFANGDEHTYEYPKEELEEDKKVELERLEKMVKEGRTAMPSEEEVAQGAEEAGASAPAAASSNEAGPSDSSASRPPIFEIHLTVSSGTYIRSIVHDIGLALGSVAHVVKLTRTRQGEFVLEPPNASTVLSAGDGTEETEGDGADVVKEKTADGLELETFTGGCVEWSLLEKAIEEQAKAKKEDREVEGRDQDGWLEWERELLRKCKRV